MNLRPPIALGNERLCRFLAPVACFVVEGVKYRSFILDGWDRSEIVLCAPRTLDFLKNETPERPLDRPAFHLIFLMYLLSTQVTIYVH